MFRILQVHNLCICTCIYPVVISYNNCDNSLYISIDQNSISPVNARNLYSRVLSVSNFLLRASA